MAQQTLYAEVLPLNADCVECCPFEGWQALMAVGTYQLDTASQNRNGQLRLYHLPNLLDQPEQAGAVSTADVPGIFDAAWIRQDHPTISLALADGCVSLHECGQDGQLGATSSVAVGACMCLSLDWQDAHSPRTACVTTDKGQLALLQATGAALTVSHTWDAHHLEVWTAAFDPHQEWLLFSGADDCGFKAWDVRQQPVPVFSNTKAHGAGVTCISCHPRRRHCVVTGSYDDQLRLWDTRNATRPVVVSQLDAAGGLWRLKWHPSDASLLLAARMYNGFAIVRCGDCEPARGGGGGSGGGHGEAGGGSGGDRAGGGCGGGKPARGGGGGGNVGAGDGGCDSKPARGGGGGGGGGGDAVGWLHGGSLQLVEEYSGHGSIAYGADWYRGPVQQRWLGPREAGAGGRGSGGGAPGRLDDAAGGDGAGGQGEGQLCLLGTCSFYDSLLHVWVAQTRATQGEGCW